MATRDHELGREVQNSATSLFADLPEKSQTILLEGAGGLPGVLGILENYFCDEDASETYREWYHAIHVADHLSGLPWAQAETGEPRGSRQRARPLRS